METSADEVPRILVAGATRVGKSILCQSVTSSNGLSSSTITTWLIKTKYYTASVELHEADVESATSSGRPEALVLVFSLINSETLELVQGIARSFDLDSVEVKVLCGTHVDCFLATESAAKHLEDIDLPPCFHEAADWSIENGFEFVACCPGRPSIDAELTLDGDRQGVARIVEALQAHMWPSLTMQSSAAQPLNGSAQTSNGASMLGPDSSGSTRPSINGVANDSNASSSSSSMPAAESETAMDAPSPGAMAAVTRSESQVASPRQEQSATEAAASEVHSPAAAAERDCGAPSGLPPSTAEGPVTEAKMGREKSQEEVEAEEERMLDGLERLVTEVQGHKARLASLPDAERRDQAAALALRMLEMLGGGEEASSEEGEE